MAFDVASRVHKLRLGAYLRAFLLKSAFVEIWSKCIQCRRSHIKRLFYLLPVLACFNTFPYNFNSFIHCQSQSTVQDDSPKQTKRTTVECNLNRVWKTAKTSTNQLWWPFPSVSWRRSCEDYHIIMSRQSTTTSPNVAQPPRTFLHSILCKKTLPTAATRRYTAERQFASNCLRL